MGTTFRRGKKWGINYIDDQGRQIRKLVSPYKETAQLILNKLEVEIAEGKYLDIRKSKKILFEDFAQQYLDTHVKLQNKNFGNQADLIKGLVKHFKGHYLDQIDPVMVRKYLSFRLKTVKPSSANRDLMMLKSMFNRAIEWEILFKPNPTKDIKPLPENNERCRWLTEEEQLQLLANCLGIARVLVLMALQTGMRWGEIRTLKWRQSPQSNYVDFENNVIYIHESQAKSKKSRYIPLGETLKKELLNIPHQPNTDYIFLNPQTHKPIGSLKRSFKTTLKRTGIADFKFHDLRHTFASNLVLKGVNLYVVQKLLGHATPKMTQRYAHLGSDQLREAIEKIDIQRNSVMYNIPSTKNSTNLAQPCIN